jgi:hypothetical protein
MAGVTWGTTILDSYSYIIYYDKNFNIVHTINRYQNYNDNNGISNVNKVENININESSILTDNNGVTLFNIVFNVDKEYDYIRISATGDGANMIVTINEEIIL